MSDEIIGPDIAGHDVTLHDVTWHDGEVTRDLGEYKYTMPRVVADQLLLWPERPLVDDIRIHQDPFFWGGPWWPISPVVALRSSNGNSALTRFHEERTSNNEQRALTLSCSTARVRCCDR